MDMDTAAAADLGGVRLAWVALRRDWALTEPEVERLLPDGGADRARPPAGTERRIRLLIEINNRCCLSRGDVRDVLRIASPVTGWLTPLELMSGAIGDLRRVRDLAEMGLLR